MHPDAQVLYGEYLDAKDFVSAGGWPGRVWSEGKDQEPNGMRYYGMGSRPKEPAGPTIEPNAESSEKEEDQSGRNLIIPTPPDLTREIDTFVGTLLLTGACVLPTPVCAVN
ncbi:hypothetical protein EV648_103111 [Kribbella sp. VKM Ac-2568]|nr:hypothetical protein EV648_103111 [Kribbella sp. VKM Ac-2568]